MKRLPIHILFALTLIATYFAFDYFHTRWALAKHYLDEQADNIAVLEAEASLAKVYHAVEGYRLDSIATHLQGRIKGQAFNFWVISRDQEVLASSEATELELSMLEKHEPGQTRFHKGFSYVWEPLSDGTDLYLGHRINTEGYVQLRMKSLLPDLVTYFASVVALCFVVFVFYTRDIMAILKVVKSRGRRSYGSLSARSKEGEIFIQGLAGYQETVEELQAKNQALGRQVLPSLKKEILSGKRPPYEFNCTLVRADINNFGRIFNTHDRGEFMAIINRFFIDVSHVVSRYNGLIHEFIGDEVIFYFKDEDHPNSFLIALSAVRDIQEVAALYDEETKSEKGYPFTVKVSLAHGSLRFGPLVNGFSLAGAILIETVRFLSHINEKEEGVVYFEDVNLERLENLVRTREAARVSLKSYAETKLLHAYVEHTPITEVLNTLDDRSVASLTYYRRDSDICQILRALRKRLHELPTNVILKTMAILRFAYVTRSDGSIKAQLVWWWRELEACKGKMDDKKRVMILSASVMLARNLLPREEYDTMVETMLESLLKSEDKRLVANVLDVLSHFKAGADPKFVSQLLAHEDNRVAANAIINEGLRDLNPSVIKRLKKMLNSASPAFTASALYAIGELAAYHHAQDAVYYGAQVDFHAIARTIPRFLQHPDAIVRRQAILSSKKIADDRVLAEVIAHIGRDPRSLLAREIQNLLGHDSVDIPVPQDKRTAA